MNCLYFKKLKGYKDSKKRPTKLFNTSFGTVETVLDWEDVAWVPAWPEEPLEEDRHENVAEEARGEEAPQAEPQENVVWDSPFGQMQLAHSFRRAELFSMEDITHYLETLNTAPHDTTWVIHT